MKGAKGILDIVFRKKTSGKTYVAKQYFKLPLQVLPAFYQDDDGCAFLYLLNPSGGILQNDTLLTDLLVEEDAKALVTTPSNNKFYKMDSGHATLINTIKVEKGGEMEYLPEHNVPFAMSKTYQETKFYLDKGATLIAFDMVTSGRKARGENFLYDLYSTKTKIYVDNQLKVYEYGKLEPAKRDVHNTGVLEGNTINASVYFYNENLEEKTINKINKMLETKENVIGGVTVVDKGLGIVRILGSDILEIQETMLEAWQILRLDLLQKPAVRIRKY